MPRIEINIEPTEIAAICDHRGWQKDLPNPAYNPATPEDPTKNARTISNPEGRQAFVKRTIVEFLRAEAHAGRKKARQDARKVEDEADRSVVEANVS